MAAMTFTELYDRFFSKVYNYVLYHVRLPAESDDVTGRIFESALNSYGTYDPARSPVQAWLFTIARNAVIDWARARNRRGEVSLEDAAERAGADPRPEAVFERKEEAGLLLDAVGALDDRSRDIIALKFSSGLTNRDIALMTGLGESNVGIVIYRAVKKMQAFLEGKKKL
ncbi:MAG: sigma-70 family RNA polymerase sigma factor [Elusimicrobiales bacterium]|nr:sigma-70 family RNA polymerase sigma factor [Elusimicrobiales bacterium]